MQVGFGFATRWQYICVSQRVEYRVPIVFFYEVTIPKQTLFFFIMIFFLFQTIELTCESCKASGKCFIFNIIFVKYLLFYFLVLHVS